MDTLVKLSESDVRLRVSKSAEKAFEALAEPIYAEMELYFSCMIRKVVRFYQQPPENREFALAGKNLAICFRPVATASCGGLDEDSKPPLADFPVKNPAVYMPHWLEIDFIKGKWTGNFGYTSGKGRRLQFDENLLES